MQGQRFKAGVNISTEMQERIEKIMKNTPKQKLEEQKKQEQQEKIEVYLEQLEIISETQKTQIQQTIEAKRENLLKYFYEQQEDNIFLHIDIDMFFAAVEIIENPDLKDKPLIVGKTIVSTSNYIARKFGIRSAMPVFLAQELCPDLCIVDVNINLYKKYSEKFYSVLREYDENLIYIGSDESCLNITKYIEFR